MNKFTIDNYDEFKSHVLSCYPQEACGFLIDNKFIPSDNLADDPVNYFSISLKESEKYYDKDYAIIHSHTMNSVPIGYDPRTPSHEDTLSQDNAQVPFGIVHTDGENLTDILWFGTEEVSDLLNREYVSYVYDCFTIARDYYKLNYNIDFGNHPRPPNWYEWNPHYIHHHFKDLGLVEIKKEEMKEGDILLFTIASKTINHIGIVISDNKFIHHLYNRKSCEDTISKWQRQLSKVLRHKDLING